jgi:pimeloyl-ACP methyl ester carboxylesterase
MMAVVLPLDDTGGDGTPVLLLHAGIADRRMWRDQLQPLADAGLRVVAPDLPGFGEAPVAPGEQAPWNDVLGVLDDLGLERIALVGNSFGGAVAQRVAVVAPERVSSLLLVSAPAPGIEPGPDLRAAWQVEEEALARGDLDAAAAAVVDAWTLPDAPAELRDLVAAMQRRAYVVQGDSEPAEAPDPLDEDPDALARLDVPTIAAAGEHDRVEFTEGARRLAETIPGARHVVIEDAGHLAPLETPERFRALVLELAGAR